MIIFSNSLSSSTSDSSPPRRLSAAGLALIGLTKNQIVRTVPLNVAPIDALAAGPGFLWISTDNGVYRLAVSSRRLLPVRTGGLAAPLAFGRGRLFIYGGGPGDLKNHADVSDPLNPSYSHVVELQSFNQRQAPGPLAFVDGSLWAWEYGAAGCCSGRTLWRVDTANNRVVGRWKGPTDQAGNTLPQGVAVGAEGAWRIRGGVVARIYPKPTRGSERGYDLHARSVAVGGGSVWVVSPGVTTSRLTEIDASSGAIVWRRTIDGRIQDITVGDGSVWLDNRPRQQILRIDIAAHHSFPPIRLPSTPGAMVASNSGLWVGYPVGQLPASGPWPPEG